MASFSSSAPPPHQPPFSDPPLGIPLLLPASAQQSTPPTRRLPPPCWTPEETSALIDAYRNKWYSLRRGNLRAAHWDDVADTVHRFCPHVCPPKTSVQCRHKMEKLRKRYRNELHRAKSLPHHRFSSGWIYFSRMDSMEKGAVDGGGNGGGKVAVDFSPVVESEFAEDDYDDDDGDLDGEDYSNEKEYQRNGLRIRFARKNYDGFDQIPNPNPNPNPNPRFGLKSSRYNEFGSPPVQVDNNGVRFSTRYAKNSGVGPSSGVGMGVNLDGNVMRKKRSVLGKRERERGGSEKGDNVAMAMVEAIRMLGEGYVRTERTKMEMMRDAEMARMKAELNRTQMMLECHQTIVEAFVKGWSGHDHIASNNNNDDDDDDDDKNHDGEAS